MKRLAVGLIGHGIMGRRRAEAIRERPGLDLVAVSDTPEETGGLLAGLPDLDLVFVCVPNDQAAPTCLAALERGLHVFCEKPPARSAAELRPVLAAAETADRVLMYGFNHRLHGSVRRLRDLADSGALGALRALRGVYGKPGNAGWRIDPEIAGGGILLDQGIHMLDLMLQLAPDLHPVAARVRGAPLEDDVLALFEGSGGVSAFLHSSAREPRCIFRLEAVFDEARVTLDGILSGSMAYAPERLLLDPREGEVLVEEFEEDRSWVEEVAAMAAAVRVAEGRRQSERGAAAVLSGAGGQHGAPSDALRVMELVELVHELGRP